MNKYLKILIAILVSLLVLIILVSYFAPKQLIVKESIKIEAPAVITYNLVNDYSKWPLWSPWEKLDTNIVHSYTDKSYGVGAKWSWKGNEKVGEGSQTILASEESKSIKMSLEFNGVDGEAISNWTFNESDNTTEVSWDFESPETPFFFKAFNLLMKGALTDSYKEGLNNLKKISEERYNEKIYRGMKIEEVQPDEKYFIIRRQEVSFEDMQQFYAQNLGALFARVQTAGLEMQGMPCGLYYKWDELRGVTDMAAGIPLAEAADFDDYDSLTIPSGRAIQIDYYGDYEGLAEPHTAIDEYMKDYGLLNNPPMIEEYLTDPGEESDPSKWLTRILYYIQE